MVTDLHSIHKSEGTRRGGYTMAGYRLDGFIRDHGLSVMGMLQNPNEYTPSQRSTYIRVVRNMYEENPIFHGVVERMVDGIVGTGFTVQAATGTSALNERLEKAFKNYSQSPETREIWDFVELQRTVVREWILTGEVLLYKTKGKLQVFTSEEICGKMGNQHGKHSGVVVDDLGRYTKFLVRRGLKKKTLKAADCIFIANLPDARRVRGALPLLHIIPLVYMISDVIQCTAESWDALAHYAIAVSGGEAPQNAYKTIQDQKLAVEAGGVTEPETEPVETIALEGGGHAFVSRDGSIKGVSQDIPNQSFPESIKAYFRILGQSMGIPIEILMMDYSNTNYATIKAALVEALGKFSQYQKFFGRSFISRVWKWQTGRAMASPQFTDVPDVPETLEHRVISAKPKWLAPKEEADAWGTMIDRNFADFDEVMIAQGKDPEEARTRLKKRMETAWDDAVVMNAKTGISTEILWNRFMGYDAGKTAGAQMIKENASNG